MRAAIYDPYLDTGGGGERYMMTVASILAKHGWSADVVWPDPRIGRWLQERLGIDLSKVSFVEDIAKGVGYDLVFWLSDGSIPTLFGKKNIIHFQTPFQNAGGRSLFNRLKLVKISHVVCNSAFTKRFVDKEYGVSSDILYPPIDVDLFKPLNKDDVILFVGRFSHLQQLKRQDMLLDSFARMYKKGFRGWRLVLAGGSEVGGRDFVAQLKKMAVGLPVDILENLPLDKLRKYYGRAKIFWSAVGYGADEEKQPEQVEHFGIGVVEAQASECVPIVIARGGHKEIVENGRNGFLWDSPEELCEITQELAKNERRRKEIATKARQSSKKFSTREFEKKFLQIIR